MSQKQLIDELKNLHATLQESAPEEVQHRMLIGEMLENLESQDLGTGNFDELSDMADTLRMLLIDYEDRHPVVAGVLRSLSNTLAGMGI